jgi:hypothetical protein
MLAWSLMWFTDGDGTDLVEQDHAVLHELLECFSH